MRRKGPPSLQKEAQPHSFVQTGCYALQRRNLTARGKGSASSSRRGGKRCSLYSCGKCSTIIPKRNSRRRRGKKTSTTTIRKRNDPLRKKKAISTGKGEQRLGKGSRRGGRMAEKGRGPSSNRGLRPLSVLLPFWGKKLPARKRAAVEEVVLIRMNREKKKMGYSSPWMGGRGPEEKGRSHFESKKSHESLEKRRSAPGGGKGNL